ncbi:hypothetical protein B0T09DRAFT_350970 [Sordaria sp. MPI-SDFR-AT-0083]|nr:hypothetical protein B0T09DRAFT_350970 [Sordaria sp. MPI-SDFR-AT-0083]
MCSCLVFCSFSFHHLHHSLISSFFLLSFFPSSAKRKAPQVLLAVWTSLLRETNAPRLLLLRRTNLLLHLQDTPRHHLGFNRL